MRIIVLHVYPRRLLRAVHFARNEIMAAIDELRDTIRAYIAKNRERDAGYKAAVKAAVDKALADDEIADAEAIRVLDQEIKDAETDNPPVEVPPVFEPSNQ